jgi:hypothetical protein
MIGVQAALAQLFYDFCLDDHVPSYHLLRSIDRAPRLRGSAPRGGKWTARSVLNLTARLVLGRE